MYINTYGNKKDPVILLLAPILVCGENIYQLMKPYFASPYYVIAPDHGGHGNAGCYVGLGDESKELRNFLIDKEIKNIDLVYGAGLGSVLAMRVLRDPSFEVGHVWLDSCAMKESPMLQEMKLKHTYRKWKKEQNDSYGEAAEALVKLYGDKLAGIMSKNLIRVTANDLDTMAHVSFQYDYTLLAEDKQEKIHLEYGEKEPDLAMSKAAIEKMMPKVKPVVRKGCGQFGYLMNNTEFYVRDMQMYMNGMLDTLQFV